MVKIFLTFGQTHVHHWKGQRLDKDCVLVVEDAPSEIEAIDALLVLLEGHFSITYSEEAWREVGAVWVERYITIPWEEIKVLSRIPRVPKYLREEKMNTEIYDKRLKKVEEILNVRGCRDLEDKNFFLKQELELEKSKNKMHLQAKRDGLILLELEKDKNTRLKQEVELEKDKNTPRLQPTHKLDLLLLLASLDRYVEDRHPDSISPQTRRGLQEHIKQIKDYVTRKPITIECRCCHKIQGGL